MPSPCSYFNHLDPGSDLFGQTPHRQAGNAAQADHWIPGLVQRIRQTTGAQPYLKRPAGRPAQQLREWCHEFYYKAESWEQHLTNLVRYHGMKYHELNLLKATFGSFFGRRMQLSTKPVDNSV